DGVNGAHVIAMAVLLLTAIGHADTERGAEQRGFDIVHTQRVAAQQRLYIAAANQRRQRRNPTGMDHNRPRDYNPVLSLLEHLLHKRGSLADGSFELALRRDAVRHESEREPVALLRFGHNADASQPGDHFVARANVTQTAAGGAPTGDYDQSVHALIFDFEPL